MSITKIDIQTKELELIEGIKKSDIDFLDKVLHTDLLCMIPNGTTITKEMDLASHRAAQMVVEKLECTIEEIQIIDDTAIVTVVYDTKGKMLGNPIEGKFKYLRVWKQFDDGLKVIAVSCFAL